MSTHESAFLRHQQKRWLRPDASRWLREDAARYRKPGYQNHHIEEQSLLRDLGLSKVEIDNPENVVRIPTLKHYDISAWYGRPNEEFGGLSPRDYLRDKDAAERRQIGLRALREAGVLK